MKRIRLLGLALIAIFALGAFASASALAENPEILPVPSAGSPANFTSKTTITSVLLGTKKENEVKCLSGTNKGSFTSQDLGTVTIEFKECSAKGAKCKSPGQVAGVILLEGDLHLVDVLPTGTLDLGVVITPHEDKSAADLSFECGILKIVILGAVIGVVDNAAGALLKDLEKFKELKALWKEKTSGEQEIKTCDLLKAFCEGKTFELKADFGKGEELVSQLADATLTFEKEYEVHF